jgi:hypothetical protein
MGGYEPSPVMSDERSPKTQMNFGEGLSRTKAHTGLCCAHTALQRMPLRATAGGAMQRGGALMQAALRCNAFRLSGWAHSRGALGPL